MRPYSLDLRVWVAAAVDEHEDSQAEIARRFDVSPSFITRLLRRRVTGSVAPKPHGGGHPPALDHEGQERLRQEAQHQADATLAERAERVGIPGRIMAVFRTLRRLKITRKKKSLHADERDSPRVRRKRRASRRTMAGIDPEHVVAADETGAHTAMTRTSGRAPAVSASRAACPAGGGAMDTPTFQSYVEQILEPPLQSGDVVIWDNLKPHKDKTARASVEQAQARVEPLPPYSPDRTPIEKLWSKVKGVLRTLAGRTTEAVFGAMRTAFGLVTLQDIRGWFESCGLCATQT